MKTYAEILNGKVTHVGTCANNFTPEFEPPLECVIIDPALSPQPEEGWEYRGGCFIQPEETVALEPALTLTIDGITGGSLDGLEVTVNAGGALTATGRITDAGGSLVPVTATFRLPIQASDGRERLVAAVVTEGAVSVAWTPKESGVWSITQDLVNLRQPDTTKMKFAGLTVYVLEA